MKLVVYHVVKNFQHILEPDSLLLLLRLSQDLAICLHPEPDQSTLHPSILTFKINFSITLTSEPRQTFTMFSFQSETENARTEVTL